MTEPPPQLVPLVNVPNALTVLRLIMVPLFGWMLLAHPHETNWRWWTFGVFVVAIATDFIDGKIARKYQLITDFGKLWDPIADKAITGMAFVGLSIIGELPWWVTIIILVREWGITGMRFAIKKYGVMAANRGGKVKTFTQTFALFGYIAPVPLWLHLVAVFLMGAAFALTVVTGIDYLWEAYKLRRDYQLNHGVPAGQAAAPDASPSGTEAGFPLVTPVPSVGDLSSSAQGPRSGAAPGAGEDLP